MKVRNTFRLWCVWVDTTVQTSKLGSNTYSGEFGYWLCYNKCLLLLLLLLWFAVVVWIASQETAFNSKEAFCFRRSVTSQQRSVVNATNRDFPLKVASTKKYAWVLKLNPFRSRSNCFLTLIDVAKYKRQIKVLFFIAAGLMQTLALADVILWLLIKTSHSRAEDYVTFDLMFTNVLLNG